MSAPAQSGDTTTTINAESKIKKVVLFSDRAQVFRTGNVKVTNGDYTILSDGLWSNVNRDTLQVATSPVAGASVILRSVQFTTIQEVVDVRPQRREIDEKLRALDNPLQDVQDEIDLADRAMANFSSLKSRLTTQMEDASKSKKGSPFIYDPSLWIKFNTFITQGIAGQRNKKRDAERRKADLDKKKGDLEAERRRLGNSDERRTSREVAEVVVTVLTDKPGQEVSLDFMLSYMVNQNSCSWKAQYDLRIDKETRTIGVTYSGMVQQSTGEDWKDIRLELSTAKAHVGGEIPNFTSPWYLKKRQPVYYNNNYDNEESAGGGMQLQMMQQQLMSNMMQQMMPSASAAASPAAPPRPRFAAATASSAQVNSSAGTSATFTIQALATVLADNEPVKVSIAIFELPIYFRYSAVPKLDPNVYLKVKAVNNTDYHLLAGKCNIFADEQLVGRSQVDDVAPNEEAWFFLGQDAAVKVDRKELSKKNVEISGGFLSGKPKTRIEYSYKFTAKNTKATKEEVVIWDQFPISDDSRIVVSLITPKPENEGKDVPKENPFFKVNEVKFIEWILNLMPGEERVFEFVFHIEHPQENIITL